MKNHRLAILAKCLSMVPARERKKISLLILGQLLLTVLELSGVALFGILAIISISGIKSSEPGTRTRIVLEQLHLTNFPLEYQVTILSGGALVLLTVKTLLTYIITKRILSFLSVRSAVASSELLKKVLSSRLLLDQEKSRQETLYSITGGVNLIIVGVIGSIASLLADIFSLVILAVGLFVYSPTMTLISISYFALIGLFNYRSLHLKVEEHSKTSTMLSIKNNETTLELIGTFRETFLSGRDDYYLNRFTKERMGIARASASLAIYPNVSKYVVEISMLLGVLALAAFQFLTTDAVRAIGSISIFLAASTRVAPALLRLQQGFFNIKGNLAASVQSLEMVEKLQSIAPSDKKTEEIKSNHKCNIVEFKSVNFKHKNGNRFEFENLEFEIKKGSRVAFVGPSGAGKSTIIDLMLSLKLPSGGSIRIEGVAPNVFIEGNPGKIGFVPQSTFIVDDTLIRNIALGVPDDELDIHRVEKLINELDLTDLNSPANVSEKMGDSGNKISGGQRQRIGIARAIYSEPDLLILDEATSSLDADSESRVVTFLDSISKDMTLITVAHRLSTVLQADQVLYIDSGKLIAKGTFSEVRQAVPDFDRQARLMGL